MRKAAFFLACLWVWPGFLTAATFKEYYQSALTEYEKGEYQSSIQDCRQALSLKPTLWQADQVMGQAYSALGQKQNAYQAVEKSLEIHPDNPALQKFAEQLKASLPAAPSSEAETDEEDEGPTPAPTPHDISDAKLWAKIYGGYANGALGDFSASANEWKALLSSIVRVGAGNDGDLVSVELGVALDKTNGLALNVTGAQYSPLAVEGLAATIIGAKLVLYTYQQDISPSFFSSELAYYHFFPLGKDSRFFVKAGGGLGLGNANLFEQSNFSATYVANDRTAGPSDLSAFSPCLSGGLGWEWMVADGLGIELSARGRYAVFSQLTGSFTTTDSNGNVVNSGTAGLYKGPKGVVLLEYNNAVLPNNTWANLDFSGFDVGMAVNAYFF